MDLTRGAIEARLQGLRKGYGEKQAEFERLRLDLAAQEGAIQDCEWFLSQFPEPGQTNGVEQGPAPREGYLEPRSAKPGAKQGA